MNNPKQSKRTKLNQKTYKSQMNLKLDLNLIE